MAHVMTSQVSAGTGPGLPTRVGLVAGASGIVGENLCKHLLTRGWKVYGTTRKEKSRLPPDVRMMKCDLEDRDSVVEAFKSNDVSSVSHLFYCAWAPGAANPKTNNKEEMFEFEKKTTEKNSKMFRNFLDVACEFVGKGLQHVHLLTGTKYYGVHLGPDHGYKTPSKEDDPRMEFPLFYYAMEDYLKEKNQQSSNAAWTWSVIRPDAIIGSGMNNFMNLGVSIAIYAAICKEKGTPLIFPGTEKAYTSLKTFSDINVVCRAQLWMSDSDISENKNQAFNINNGQPVRWKEVWNVIGDFFGTKAEPPGKEPVNLSKFFEENASLWKDLCKQELVKECDLKSLVTPDFMEFYVSKMEWDNVTSMDKANNLGFKETMSDSDCWKTFLQTLREKTIIP